MKVILHLNKAAMSFEFRQYIMNEPCYQQAWDLRERILRTPLDLSLTAEDRANDARCWHYGLFNDRQIIASVTVQLNTDSVDKSKQVKLRQMVVEPVYQGRGLGRQLIEQTEAVLRSKAITSISLAARLPAVAFYQKLGFIAEGPIYHHLRIDHKDMTKKLL